MELPNTGGHGTPKKKKQARRKAKLETVESHENIWVILMHKVPNY